MKSKTLLSIQPVPLFFWGQLKLPWGCVSGEMAVAVQLQSRKNVELFLKNMLILKSKQRAASCCYL